MKKNNEVIEVKEQETVVEETMTEETAPKKGFFTKAGEKIDKHGKTIVKGIALGAGAIGAFTIGRIFGGAGHVEDHDEVEGDTYDAEYTESDDE